MVRLSWWVSWSERLLYLWWNETRRNPGMERPLPKVLQRTLIELKKRLPILFQTSKWPIAPCRSSGNMFDRAFIIFMSLAIWYTLYREIHTFTKKKSFKNTMNSWFHLNTSLSMTSWKLIKENFNLINVDINRILRLHKRCWKKTFQLPTYLPSKILGERGEKERETNFIMNYFCFYIYYLIIIVTVLSNKFLNVLDKNRFEIFKSRL